MTFGEKTYKQIADEVLVELSKAVKKFPVFNSSHEGYAVLKEEVDELWDEVKKGKPSNPEDKQRLHEEAIQVAAMAMRFVHDICQVDKDKTLCRICNRELVRIDSEHPVVDPFGNNIGLHEEIYHTCDHCEQVKVLKKIQAACGTPDIKLAIQNVLALCKDALK